MSGEGGEGGYDGADASPDVGVEAAETVESVETAETASAAETAETAEDSYLNEAPEDDPEAFKNHLRELDPALFEADATPETQEEREARLRREAAAAAQGVLPVQLAMRKRGELP
ncbi:hypothetical protein ACTVZO_37920 [Streptomyces sp. IBSNAI002]|uniref:hypothetical protein n=1 Tax=Streptomyces sp. IBSNAI002 TaxID=3457500 RepID=UPI003FD14191